MPHPSSSVGKIEGAPLCLFGAVFAKIHDFGEVFDGAVRFY